MIRANKNFMGFEWHYAVTNKRVLFQHPAEDGPYTEKLAIGQLTKVYLQPVANPFCWLVFERKLFLGISERIDFYISDAAEVQELVVSLLPGIK